MTEQQAKFNRKLNQAVNDAIREMPDRYYIGDAYNDINELLRNGDMEEKKRLSTKIIAGLLRWQIDNL